MKYITNKYFKLDEDNQIAVRRAASAVITQSEIMTRAACPRKWFYRYALMLDKIGAPNYHLMYGTMMHAALAELYKGGHYGESPKEYPIEVPNIIIPESVVLTPQDRAELDLTKAKVQIMFNAYRIHYFKEDSFMRVAKVEEDMTYKWKGLTLTGRLDMAASPKSRDGIFIWDWKTAGRFDASMLDAWSFRFQFLFYAWLYWKVTGNKPSGIMANGLAKSLLRPKIVNKKLGTKETVNQYLDRIREDARDHREKFFYRQRMPFGKGVLERFEEDILAPHIDTFLLMRRSIIDINTNVLAAVSMAMNTGHCHIYNSFCEFLPLCKDGPLMLGEYQTRTNKHQELETNPEIGEA